jgi:hypothetical protein
MACSQDPEDCAPGLICLHYDKVYACRKFCGSNADCTPGTTCTATSTCGMGRTMVGKYCSKPCSDVVTAAGSAVCAPGFRCNFGCDGTTPTPPTCDFETGTQKSGPCSGDTDCAPGYYCLNAGDGGGVCTQACNTNADCAMGTCTGTLTCGGVATTYHYCKLSG